MRQVRRGATLVWLACASLATAALSVAQPAPKPVFAGAPSAVWIAPPGVPRDSFVVFHARRVIELTSAPSRFILHVSADNRYRLFVNGESVATGPQRADVDHWRYETLDLAPRLRAGRNVIAAVVWNWGADRPIAQHSVRTGLLVQGDGPTEAALVNTGAGWKLRVDSAYAPAAVTWRDANGYYAAAPGERVDGARVPWGWEAATYRDDDWYAVSANDRGSTVGVMQRRAIPGESDFGGVSQWQLVPRDIPPMQERVERLAHVRRTVGVPATDAFVQGVGEVVVPPHTSAMLLLDQGRTTNAYPVLDVSGGRGATITLTYAEALRDARGERGHRDSVTGRTISGVHDVFVSSAGDGERQRYQPLWWRSYRYVQLDVRTGDAPLRLHDLHGVATGYPFAMRGRFTSDQPWIDSVWTLSWNGARLGAWETYMDTPYYEQLQYIGDTRLQALISLYVSGDDRLMRQALTQFDDSRTPEGLTLSRYPSAQVQVIPPFSLIHVAMVHDYFMHRDDPAFVRRLLPGVRTVLDWYGRQVDTTGMLGPMPYWNFVDWAPQWSRGIAPGADDGHSTAVALLYAYALQRAADMETRIGTPGTGAAYRTRADAIIRATRARAWDATRGLFRDQVGGVSTFSQQSNVLAVLTGAVPATQSRAVMQRVLSDTSLTQATYYFAWYVREAMRQAGLGDAYVTQLAPWRGMLALGLTSTPENPEPTRSDTHAWSAHPLHGLLATVLGVRSSSPGFHTVRIAPQLGSLQRAEGSVPHPLGDIEVQLVRRGTLGVRAVVVLPQALRGEFVWRGVRTALHGGLQVLTF